MWDGGTKTRYKQMAWHNSSALFIASSKLSTKNAKTGLTHHHFVHFHG